LAFEDVHGDPKLYSKLRNEPNTCDESIGFSPHILQLIFDSSAKTIHGENDGLCQQIIMEN
jgi:hypothetical protein